MLTFTTLIQGRIRKAILDESGSRSGPTMLIKQTSTKRGRKSVTIRSPLRFTETPSGTYSRVIENHEISHSIYSYSLNIIEFTPDASIIGNHVS